MIERDYWKCPIAERYWQAKLNRVTTLYMATIYRRACNDNNKNIQENGG